MMDSGSSGSIQSSSGGEEEYDSRAEGLSSGFLNNPPAGAAHVGPMAKPNPPPLPPPATHHPHSSSNSLFDPFSNFFDPLLPTRSHQNSLLNLDTHWPPRHNPPIQLPPSSSQPQSLFMSTNTQLQLPNQPSTTQTNVQAPRPNLSLTATDPTHLLHNHNNNNLVNTANNAPSASVRNPRKRTRASRRAPTTVLTTDTSNFRAMVQEFTGIPAPPFTPASSFPRARLDLFGGTSSSSPPYLLRPFPQKLSPFPSNNSANTATTTTAATNSLVSPSSDFLLTKQNSNQNQNHHLHPLSSIFNLQPPPLQQPSINLLGSDLHVSLDAAQTTTDSSNRNPHHLHQTPLPEELLSGNVSVRDSGGNILPASWGSGGGGEGASDQALFRSMNGKYCTSTKLNNNYSASSSLDFHGDKGSENVTNRSEGMIESWICSSD